MRNNDQLLPVLGIIVAILACFAAILSGLPRILAIILLAAILLYLLYAHIHKSAFFAICILAFVATSMFVYRYLHARQPVIPDPPTSDLARAMASAREQYNRKNFEGAIQTLEPFKGKEGFEANLVDSEYILLGFAYLSLPQPRCTDAVRLLPWISQEGLESSLVEKCKSVSCNQCQKGYRL